MNRKEGDLKEKKNKQCKKGGDDSTVFNDGIGGEAGRETEQLDGIKREKVENRRKEKKRKRQEHNDDPRVEKLHNVNGGVEDIIGNESDGHSSRNEAESGNMEGHAVLEEDGNKDKKRRAKSVRKHSNGDKKISRIKKGAERTDPSENSTLTEI